ncbi:protein translocase subunit SecD [Candidatus Microgenomates bacterium]|nr:protein translocase subunit SecD [Candidatus Microgenomates bacterium]
MKSPRTLLWIIVISFFAAFIAISPIIPLRLNVGPLSVARDISYELGLDLRGGTSVTLEADMQNITSSDRNSALESAKSVIERRVNFLGVAEPVVQTARVGESHRIITELPGVQDTSEAVALIGKTAQLEFMEQNPLAASPSAELAYLPTGITGKDLKRAFVSFDPNTGKPEISFELTSEGGKKFKEATSRILQKPEDKRRLAIALDGEIISAPTVQSVIEDRGRITGQFTSQEAKTLAIQLNAGALPVPLKILQQRTIGATLGVESVQKSLLAGLVGFGLVAIFMTLFYRIPGLLAVVALIIYTSIVLTIFKLVPVTLTLAGIAAFILSIGMAVDANILIFERLREEIKWGKPKQVALELGFSRAWTSIRDSNISSLITAGILYWFGSGLVKGFALVLAIGVVVSMFSAIVVTKTFLKSVYR